MSENAILDLTQRLFGNGDASRTAEKRIYVLLLVPADFCNRRRATTPSAARVEIREYSAGRGAAAPPPAIADKIDARKNTKADDDAGELDSELMWTWFLPNPLPPPKRKE